MERASDERRATALFRTEALTLPVMLLSLLRRRSPLVQARVSHRATPSLVRRCHYLRLRPRSLTSIAINPGAILSDASKLSTQPDRLLPH